MELREEVVPHGLQFSECRLHRFRAVEACHDVVCRPLVDEGDVGMLRGDEVSAAFPFEVVGSELLRIGKFGISEYEDEVAGLAGLQFHLDEM